MADSPKLLLEPTCPAGCDPDLGRLAAVLAAAAGARWLALEIRHEGWEETFSCVIGEPEGEGTRITIAPEGRWTAAIRIDGTAVAGDGFRAAAELVLEREMMVRKLRRQVDLLRGALDTTSAAVLLFDLGGNIVYANPPADALLARQTEKDLLVVERGQASRRLLAVLCEWVDAISGSEPRATPRNEVVTLSDGSVLACEVLRVAAGDSAESGVVVLLQPVAAAPDVRIGFLAGTFGFTRREREVLQHLASGMTTAEIADHMCISQHTVKDHLKSLYRKTGTCSRSALLSLLSHGSQAGPQENGRERMDTRVQ